MRANYCTLEELSAVLAWLMNQRSESPYSRFSLFRVQFEDPLALGSAFGAADAMCRLKEFGAILAATVRDTDLVARKLSEFWVLAAECDPHRLACRLCDLAVKIEEIGLDVVRCSIGAYVFPFAGLEAINPGRLFDELRSITPEFIFDPPQSRTTYGVVRQGSGTVRCGDVLPQSCFRIDERAHPYDAGSSAGSPAETRTKPISGGPG